MIFFPGSNHRKGYHLTETANWIGYFRVMDNHRHEVAAFVLAGGQSTRMGRDKALVEFQGITLLERAIRSCKVVSSDVWIIGKSEKYRQFGQTLEDIYLDCGPLGGIHAALVNSTANCNLVLAVDMPFLSPEFLTFLIKQAQASEAVATVPEADDRLQPLCAVYKRQFLEVAERALVSGKNKITPLFAEVKTQVIGHHDLESAGFSSSIFKNWNTPDDLKIEMP